MKAKKIIAALTSLMIAVSSAGSLPLAVCVNAEEPASVDAGKVLPQADAPVVVSAAEYAVLTDEQKALYASVEVSGSGMFVTYVRDGDSRGMTIPNGSYVKKGTDINFCINKNNFDGSQLILQRGSSIDDQTLINYFLPTDDGWCYRYTVADDDVGLVGSTSDIKCPTMVSPDEYSSYEAAKKIYYAKANIQSPAYIWIGDDDTGYRVPDGYYVLKGAGLWIAMRAVDYPYYNYSINGQQVDPTFVGGNYGFSFTVYPLEDSVNVTVEQTAEISAAVVVSAAEYAVLTDEQKALYASVEVSGSNMFITYVIEGDSSGTVIPSGSYVKKGTDIYFCINKNNFDGSQIMLYRLDSNNTANLLYDYFLPTDDGWCYKYTVASDDVELVGSTSKPSEPSNPTEPSKPSIPSRPSVPSIPSEPSATPSAPIQETGTVSTAPVIPSEAETVKSIDRAHNSSITYNAVQAGVTEDILKSFSDNKYAKTLTAKLDGFKVKIDKADIEDANALADIDLSISEKPFISQSQIKKLNSLKNRKKIVQLNFNGSGDISGLKEIGIQANAGKKFSGETAVIYERKGKKLVKIGTAKVKANGYVCFNTDHLGQFLIAIW